MKHAGAAALTGVAALLAAIRARPGLIEKKPGIFYRKGSAFLHFHEDPAGMFLDLRDGADWVRLPAADEAGCLEAVDRAIRR